MPEALTESFCERCGTRYEFKAPARLNPLRKTRGLVSGLRNYIMSQDALSDAVGDAMRSEEESLAARQLEAFHESFNFCIDCRQYTCVNCWNHEAGRCRACAPIPGTDDLLERFEASFQAQHPDRVQATGAVAEPSTNGVSLDSEAWPVTDLPAAATNGHADVAWPEVELIGRREPVAEATGSAAPEAEMAVEPPSAAEPEPQSEPEPIEIAAFDSEPAPVTAAEPEWTEPVAAAEPEWTEPVAAAEPEWTEPAEAEPRVVAWEADVPFDLLPEEVYLESADEPVVAEADAPETEPTVAAIEFEPPVVAEAEPVAVEAQPEPMVAAELEPEPVVAEAQPEPELVADVETEPEIAEAPEPDLVTNVEPGPEPAAAVEPEPELTAEAEPELEPVPEAELVSNAEPEPKPEVRRATLRPIADTIMRLPAPPPVVDEPRVAAEADDPAVAARRAQLDLLGLGDPGEGPVAPAPRTVLPYRSSGASAPLPSRQAAAGATAGGSFWDASAREVAGALSQIGVQNCGQCGLSLSASARFCRRCGTRQARSA